MPRKKVDVENKHNKSLPSRTELLSWLIATPGLSTDGTMLDDARKKFHEILNSSNSPALVEWLFTQLVGPPRTVVKQEIGDVEFLHACGRVAARHFDRDQARAFIEDLKLELTESETGS
jgi:hypothetical protein